MVRSRAARRASPRRPPRSGRRIAHPMSHRSHVRSSPTRPTSASAIPLALPPSNLLPKLPHTQPRSHDSFIARKSPTSGCLTAHTAPAARRSCCCRAWARLECARHECAQGSGAGDRSTHQRSGHTVSDRRGGHAVGDRRGVHTVSDRRGGSHTVSDRRGGQPSTHAAARVAPLTARCAARGL